MYWWLFGTACRRATCDNFTAALFTLILDNLRLLFQFFRALLTTLLKVIVIFDNLGFLLRLSQLLNVGLV